MKKRKATQPYYNPDALVCADLTMERIRREILTFESRYQIDLRGLRDSVEATRIMDEAARVMTLQLCAKVASKKYAVKTVRWPLDWWQAFKLQFFSGRMLKRWPVIYEEVTLEANAYHPDVEIPNHSTYVDIINRAKYGSY